MRHDYLRPQCGTAGRSVHGANETWPPPQVSNAVPMSETPAACVPSPPLGDLRASRRSAGPLQARCRPAVIRGQLRDGRGPIGCVLAASGASAGLHKPPRTTRGCAGWLRICPRTRIAPEHRRESSLRARRPGPEVGGRLPAIQERPRGRWAAGCSTTLGRCRVRSARRHDQPDADALAHRRPRISERILGTQILHLAEERPCPPTRSCC